MKMVDFEPKMKVKLGEMFSTFYWNLIKYIKMCLLFKFQTTLIICCLLNRKYALKTHENGGLWPENGSQNEMVLNNYYKVSFCAKVA